MDAAHIDTYEAHARSLQSAMDALLAHADQLRDEAESLRLALGRCDRATAVLRRTDEPQMMGPLNSISAAHSRQRGIATGLDALETALARFEDLARDLRLLHPSVVAALRDKLPKADEAAP